LGLEILGAFALSALSAPRNGDLLAGVEEFGEIRFRDAYRRRRFILPVDGFFEWKATKGKMKQPFAIAMRNGYPFGLGGTWESWKDPTSGEWLQPSRSSPSTPMSWSPKFTTGRGTGIGAASRRRSRALR
jgi:hypothetical protein